jgi:hypothetical protein
VSIVINPIANEANRLLNVPTRLKNIVSWYLLSLMMPAPKHSLTFAAKLSGLAKSQFSRFLLRSSELAVECLKELVVLVTKELSACRELLLKQAPWTITIIIDATLQKRSSRHPGNSQKFNHGGGFVIGHQWTNIILLINGKSIPLPPIAFYSKKERRRLKLPKETEQDCVIRFIDELNLEIFVGEHCPSEVVVLMDAGYDNKKIQRSILDRGWDFVAALKCSRGVRTEKEYETGVKKSRRVDDIFWAHRNLSWNTIRDHVDGWKTKKRKEFRARELIGFLNGIRSKVKLVLSEERGSRKGRKFLACSNTKVGLGVIVRAYRKRWMIELFHKEVKSYLGFEDVSCHDFASVHSHVHWVYCAYLLFPRIVSDIESLSERQDELSRRFSNRKFAQIIQISTRFNGLESVKRYCYEVMCGSDAA